MSKSLAVGITQEEGTAPAVAFARAALERAGLTVVVFGEMGGRELEARVLANLLGGVLDLTTAELAAALLGGPRSAGRDRLTACGLRGVPQVIVPGGLDSVWFGEGGPGGREGFDTPGGGRRVRTTPEENDALGKEIALKASAARGPTVVLVPRGGFSLWDREGGPFWRPEADATLATSLRHWVSPHVPVVERPDHVNDPSFAGAAAAVLLGLLPRTA